MQHTEASKEKKQSRPRLHWIDNINKDITCFTWTKVTTGLEE